MSESYPLISCICVTYNRPHLLKRAINCFQNQNYPNKELVITYPKDDKETIVILDFVLQNSDLNLLKIERNKEDSVGNARNTAIAKCNGNYICIWDDDDFHHSSRLTFQYNSMQTNGKGYNASILSRLIMLDETTQKAYLSFSYSWEGTLLCRKEFILQNQYANLNKGEDTHIIKFLNDKKFLYRIEEAPFLYIYIYHGGNTWEYSHYEWLIQNSLLLEDEIRVSIQNLIA